MQQTPKTNCTKYKKEGNLNVKIRVDNQIVKREPHTKRILLLAHRQKSATLIRVKINSTALNNRQHSGKKLRKIFVNDFYNGESKQTYLLNKPEK